MQKVGLVVGFVALVASSASAHPHSPYCDPDLFDKLEPSQRNRYLQIATETVDAGVEFFGKQTPALFEQHCSKKGGKYRSDDSLHYCFFGSGMHVVSRIYRGRYQYTNVYPNMITAEYYEAAKRVLVGRYGPPRSSNPPGWEWSDRFGQRGWEHPFKVRVGRSGVEFFERDVGQGGKVCPFRIEEVSECL